MRRRIAQLLLAFACLMVVVVTMPDHPHPEPPQIVQPRGTAPISWSVLEQGIADQGRWYAQAASAPVTTSLPRRRSGTVRAAARDAESVYGSGACGGDLPPCSVMWCESRGSLTAQNPRSSASGKWQILDSTWNGYGGYSRAMYAPEDVQDAKARELYAGGAGRSQWVC